MEYSLQRTWVEKWRKPDLPVLGDDLLVYGVYDDLNGAVKMEFLHDSGGGGFDEHSYQGWSVSRQPPTGSPIRTTFNWPGIKSQITATRANPVVQEADHFVSRLRMHLSCVSARQASHKENGSPIVENTATVLIYSVISDIRDGVSAGVPDSNRRKDSALVAPCRRSSTPPSNSIQAQARMLVESVAGIHDTPLP